MILLMLLAGSTWWVLRKDIALTEMIFGGDRASPLEPLPRLLILGWCVIVGLGLCQGIALRVRSVTYGLTAADCLFLCTGVLIVLGLALCPDTPVPGIDVVGNPLFGILLGVNVLYATIVSRQFSRYLLASDSLDRFTKHHFEHARWSVPATLGDSLRTGAQLLFDGLAVVLYGYAIREAFQHFQEQGGGVSARLAAAFLFLKSLFALSLGLWAAHELILSERRPSLRAYCESLWVSWKALVVFTTYNIHGAAAPGMLHLDWPWNQYRARHGFTVLVLLVNACILAGPHDPGEARAVPDQSVAATPEGTASSSTPPESSTPASSWARGSEAARVVLLIISLIVSLFVFGPLGFAFFGVWFLHGRALEVYHEVLERHLKRTPPPLFALSFWVSLPEAKPGDDEDDD